MTAPSTTTRVQQAANVTRDLYRLAPVEAAGYIADLKAAAAEAAQRAEREVAIAKEWHDMHAAAEAEYDALKAADTQTTLTETRPISHDPAPAGSVAHHAANTESRTP